MATIHVCADDLSVQCAIYAPKTVGRHETTFGPSQITIPLYDPIQELGFWFLHRDTVNRLCGYSDMTTPKTLKYHGDEPHDFKPAGYHWQGPLDGIQVVRKIFAGQQPFQHIVPRNIEQDVEHSSYRFDWRYVGTRSSGYDREDSDQYFGLLYDRYRPGQGAVVRRLFDDLTLWNPAGPYAPDLEQLAREWEGHGEVRNFYWGGQSISIDNIKVNYIPDGVTLEYHVTNVLWHTHAFTAGAFIRRRCEYTVLIPEPTKVHALDYTAETVKPVVQFSSTVLEQRSTGQYRPVYPLVFQESMDGVINILADTEDTDVSTPFPYDDGQLSVVEEEGIKFFGRGDALELFYSRCRSDVLGLMSSGGYMATTAVIQDYLNVLSNNLETVTELREILGILPVREGVALLRSVRDKRLRSVGGDLADFIASSQLSYSWAIKPLAKSSTELVNNIDVLSNSIVDQLDLRPGYGTWSTDRLDWHDYVSASATVRAKVTPVRNDITAFMGMLLQVNATGLLPTTSNVWATVPYSFLVDSIVDLGGKFGMLDASLLGGLALDIEHIVVSVTITTPIWTPTDCYGQDGSMRYYARNIFRTIPFPRESSWLPNPTLPDSGWANWGSFAWLKLT